MYEMLLLLYLLLHFYFMLYTNHAYTLLIFKASILCRLIGCLIRTIFPTITYLPILVSDILSSEVYAILFEKSGSSLSS